MEKEASLQETGITAGVAAFRRFAGDGLVPLVKHGDTYEMVTANPDKHPLPSFKLLQIHYGVHKLHWGMGATGALKTIFSGDPPNDENSTSGGVVVPEEWELFLEAAVQTGIVDHASAEQWGRALFKVDQEKLRDRLREGRDFFRQLEVRRLKEECARQGSGE